MGFSYDPRPSDVDPSRPLIYLWEIRNHQGEVIYRDIGRSINGAKRPREDYQRNVENLRRGRPYRPSNQDGFREVHRQLLRADQEGFGIRLYLLQNVTEEEIDEAKQVAKERYLQKPFLPVSE
ncbi:hypothetical protein D3C77_651880 [compost metagenome]